MEDIIIPLAFFATVVLIVYFSIKYRNRAKELDHKERMLAIEKGVALPEMPDMPQTKRKEHNPFMAPFILMGIGMGYFAKWTFDSGWSTIGGYVVFFMGLGMLAAHLLNQRQQKKREEMESGTEFELPDKVDRDSKL